MKSLQEQREECRHQLIDLLHAGMNKMKYMRLTQFVTHICQVYSDYDDMFCVEDTDLLLALKRYLNE